MKNSAMIEKVTAALARSCDGIQQLTNLMEVSEDSDSFRDYEKMRFDELEHAQKLVLNLTDLISKESEKNASAMNQDEEGSAFFEGELQSKKTVEEEPIAPKTVLENAK